MDFKNPFKDLSKTQRYIAIAGALGIGGFLVIRHHSSTGSWNPWSSTSSGTTTSDGTATSIDPVTGMAYTDDSQVDPITGETYLAEAQQYGSVQAAESSVSAYGQSTATGSGIPVNPASPASTGSANTVVGSSVYTSNAAWAQAATAGLADVGYDETTVATALGAYITQTPLTAAQASLVNTAIAEYGAPPTGNLQVILQPVSKPSPTPVPTPVKKVSVTIPDVVGMKAGEADQYLDSIGLKGVTSGISAQTVIKHQDPSAGTKIAKGSQVFLSSTNKPTTPKGKANT